MTEDPRPTSRARTKQATALWTLLLVGMVVAIFLIGIYIGQNIR